MWIKTKPSQEMVSELVNTNNVDKFSVKHGITNRVVATLNSGDETGIYMPDTAENGEASKKECLRAMAYIQYFLREQGNYAHRGNEYVCDLTGDLTIPNSTSKYPPTP